MTTLIQPKNVISSIMTNLTKEQMDNFYLSQYIYGVIYYIVNDNNSISYYLDVVPNIEIANLCIEKTKGILVTKTVTDI